MRTIWYTPREDDFFVLDCGRRSTDGGVALEPGDLDRVRSSEARRALISYQRNHDDASVRALVSALPDGYLDLDGPFEAVSFGLWADDLILDIQCVLPWSESGHEEESLAAARKLVEALAVQTKSTLIDIVEDGSVWHPSYFGARIRLLTPIRGTTLGELFRRGQDVSRLCDAFTNDLFDRNSAADLIRGGAGHLLIGQSENNWLDAKSQEYDLATTKGKIGMAQAVARFANAEAGGLVVIGAHTRKVPGGEVIRAVPGVAPRYKDTVARYLRVLDHHLYPPAAGLRIDVLPNSEGLVTILIDIPPQGEELKPFLVHGAIMVDGDTEGSFISIVQRRGEGSIPITAPMVHASLAAGRALLRGKGFQAINASDAESQLRNGGRRPGV